MLCRARRTQRIAGAGEPRGQADTQYAAQQIAPKGTRFGTSNKIVLRHLAKDQQKQQEQQQQPSHYHNQISTSSSELRGVTQSFASKLI